MKASKLLIVIIPLLFLGSCALWPFGKKASDNCLDDGSCEEASNPFEEKLIGGTWYCYGESRNDPWDCSQTTDAAKIKDVEAVTASVTRRPTQREAGPDLGTRVELALNEEAISSTDEIAPQPLSLKDNTPVAATGTERLFGYGDDSFAVQLIALQTVQEVEIFAADNDIPTPFYIGIESQGSEWYVLLLGVYATKQGADAAASVWTTTHNPNSKPWVRPIGPLKAAAVRAREIGG